MDINNMISTEAADRITLRAAPPMVKNPAEYFHLAGI
jgi:hypothetical protein